MALVDRVGQNEGMITVNQGPWVAVAVMLGSVTALCSVLLAAIHGLRRDVRADIGTLDGRIEKLDTKLDRLDVKFDNLRSEFYSLAMGSTPHALIVPPH